MITYVFQKYPKILALQLFIILQEFYPSNMLFS